MLGDPLSDAFSCSLGGLSRDVRKLVSRRYSLATASVLLSAAILVQSSAVLFPSAPRSLGTHRAASLFSVAAMAKRCPGPVSSDLARAMAAVESGENGVFLDASPPFLEGLHCLCRRAPCFFPAGISSPLPVASTCVSPHFGPATGPFSCATRTPRSCMLGTSLAGAGRHSG